MLSVSGYRGIEVKGYDDDNRRRTDEDLCNYRIVRKGQLVVNTMWLNYAGLGISNYDGHVSPAYRVFDISDDVNRRYLHYLMRSSAYVAGYTRLLQGIRPNSLQVSGNEFADLPILLPSPEVQREIVDFLDRETAKADALVAKYERLIALLEEKRVALTSRAVTKGIDANIHMKDSGVEWIGEMPSHWTVRRLNSAVQEIKTGPFGSVLHAGDYIEGGIHVVNPAHIINGRISSDECVAVSESTRDRLTEYALRTGDVVMGRRGEMGRTAIVTDVENGWLCGTGCMIIRPNNAICSSGFLAQSLSSHRAKQWLSMRSQGSTMDNLSPGLISRFELALPARSEQDGIVRWLASAEESLAHLSNRARRAILLVKEHRAALVTAAVSGQLDVSHLPQGAATA